MVTSIITVVGLGTDVPVRSNIWDSTHTGAHNLLLAHHWFNLEFGHDRTRKTSLRCRGLQIKGYFYKATPIYEVSSNFSQIKANFAFAACSVNFEKMNAGNHVFYRQ